MDDFSADKWAKLSNAERIEFCRKAARQAEAAAEAETTDRLCIQAYRNLAAQWRALAAEIERDHGSSKEAPRSISF